MGTLQAAGRLEEYPPPRGQTTLYRPPRCFGPLPAPDAPDDLLSPKSSMGSNPRSPVGPFEGLTGRSDPPEKQRILARIKLVAAGVVGASLYKHRIAGGLQETRVWKIGCESVSHLLLESYGPENIFSKSVTALSQDPLLFAIKCNRLKIKRKQFSP